MPQNLTPTIEERQQEKSQGHVGFLGVYEYFVHDDMNDKPALYRSSVYNVISRDGYRLGARWQCPENQINDYLFLLGVPANYKRQ